MYSKEIGLIMLVLNKEGIRYNFYRLIGFDLVDEYIINVWFKLWNLGVNWEKEG